MTGLSIPKASLESQPLSSRVASFADHDSVEALRAEARSSLAEHRGGAALLEETPLSRSGSELVYLGSIGEQPVGYLVVEMGGSTATISELFVLPEARHVGMGHALLESAMDSARSSGCDCIDAAALPGDRQTKNFFEDHGLVARKIVVQSKL